MERNEKSNVPNLHLSRHDLPLCPLLVSQPLPSNYCTVLYEMLAVYFSEVKCYVEYILIAPVLSVYIQHNI